ncbi:unnamed protein product [Trichobilharzia regenti]|nr:unnamed protein product [Trichobilharzia regenti]
MTVNDIKGKSKENVVDKKSPKPAEKVDVAILEEDDDFEEFPAHGNPSKIPFIVNMDDDSPINSPYHTTGPYSDTSFEDMSSEHSSDSSSDDFSDIDWEYNESLIKPELADGSTNSPEATTSYSEISGFYGHEEIKQKLESMNYCSPQKSLPLSDYYMSLDSSSDEPEHKPQPFVHYYNDDSSSDEAKRGEKSEEEVKSVKTTFKRNMNFNTKM